MPIPDYMRSPRRDPGGAADPQFEERIVKKIAAVAGDPEIVHRIRHALHAETGEARLPLLRLHEGLPEFPLLLVATRFSNLADFLVGDIGTIPKFRKSTIYRLWCDAERNHRDSDDDPAVGIVFSWPRLGDCVLHTLDLEPQRGFRMLWHWTEKSDTKTMERRLRLDTLDGLLATLYPAPEQTE